LPALMILMHIWPDVKRTAIMGHRNGCDIAQL
jgi:hypothetical protein